jgi:hypothetical protein
MSSDRLLLLFIGEVILKFLDKSRSGGLASVVGAVKGRLVRVGLGGH